MKYISKLPINSIKFVLAVFLIWRISLLIGGYFSINFLSIQKDFLGGGLKNYINSPLLWGMANFDGEHYLALAKFGYQPLTYFFFPFYPLLISLLVSLVGKTDLSYLLSAQIISIVSFVLALFGITKLVVQEFNKKTAIYTLVILLIFPTSFYFAAAYTESIFLALIVWSFYAAKRNNFMLAAILAGLASATRVVGVVMLPCLLVEYWLQNGKSLKIDKRLFWILASISGILAYLGFLHHTTGDALTFLHSVEIYGAQRSSSFILLPQVFYRYIFKVLPTVGLPFNYVSIVAWLEMLTGVVFFILSIISLFKLRLSWALYSIGAFLIPTLSGSFSSMPRYVLILFPLFVLIAKYSQNWKGYTKIVVGIFSIVLLLLLQAMFLRGYWVA